MNRRNRLIPLSLLGLTLLSACAGVETGAVSPCHGQFRAEGKYYAAREQSDGTTVKNIVNLCKKHDIPVVKVTETLPEGKNYFNWLQSEYRQIAEIEK